MAMGYFEFIFNTSAYFSFIILALFGFAVVNSESISFKKLLKYRLLGAFLFCFTLAPVITYADYRSYRTNYMTCMKKEGSDAGYVLKGVTCYAPVKEGNYIDIRESYKLKNKGALND